MLHEYYKAIIAIFRTIDAQSNAFEIDITITLKGLGSNKLEVLDLVQRIPRLEGTTPPNPNRYSFFLSFGIPHTQNINMES